MIQLDLSNLMARVHPATLCVVILMGLACSPHPATAQPAPDRAAMFQAMTRAIERNRLTTLPTRCILYRGAVEGPNYLDVSVHELHDAKRQCKGSPYTSPRLFSLRYEKRTGRVLKLDDLSDDLTYERLR